MMISLIFAVFPLVDSVMEWKYCSKIVT